MDSPGRPSLRRAGSGEGSLTSVDSHPSRNLLFGEIDSNASFVTAGSWRSNSSQCNLVLSTNQTFLRLWHSDQCRDSILRHMNKPTLRNTRLVCHDFSSRAASHLFKELTVDFKPTSFTKSRRMHALKKIGHHAQKFTFKMPHSSQTFLPPLLDPETGEQLPFTYVPQVDRPTTPPSAGERTPKYGTDELTNLLISQYPPIFHAATNVPAFIRVLSSMRNLKHIAIACPGQDQPQLHRRSIVDYALISLRIAIERAPLDEFEALTLESIHPAALFYLQPILGIGSSPGSQRRWSQVQQMAIHMTSFPFDDPDRTEHLRILHAYLRAFSNNLTSLHFSWVGSQSGPSPLTLDKEPILTAPSIDRPAAPPKPLRFPKLKYMILQNAVMDSSQVASFVSKHRKRLVEFEFEDVTLRSGDWDHALKPLRKMQKKSPAPLFDVTTSPWGVPESMDVPCMWSPIEVAPEPRIMETLEPQFCFQSPQSRGFSVSKLLGIKSGKKLQKKEGSSHFGKSLKQSLMVWR